VLLPPHLGSFAKRDLTKFLEHGQIFTELPGLRTVFNIRINIEIEQAHQNRRLVGVSGNNGLNVRFEGGL
jgi:hypothetical protein